MFFLFALFLPHCFQRIFRLKLNMYDYQNLVLLFKAFVTNNHSEGKGAKKIKKMFTKKTQKIGLPDPPSLN